MAFRTKIDLSDNRQAKQREQTLTILSGRTDFGLEFSGLSSGVNLTTSQLISTIEKVSSTFSGNLTTTIFNFGAAEMYGGGDYLNVITTANQNEEQIIQEPFFVGVNPSVNPYTLQTVYDYYTGSTFDITITNFNEISPNNFTGTLTTDLVSYYSATSIDYKGDGVWASVNGKLKTQELIISKNPFAGWVLTALDTSGNTAFLPITSSGSTSFLFTTGSTGTFSIKAINGSGLNATGNNAFAIGNGTLASGNNSFASGNFAQATGNTSHAEGNGTRAYGVNSHAEGQSSVASGLGSHSEGFDTVAIGEYSHAEGNTTIAQGSTSHSEGQFTVASGDYSHAEGSGTLASGEYSHAEGIGTEATGNASHAEGNATVASGAYSHAEGNFTVASGFCSHAQGLQTESNNDYTHSSGRFTYANGLASFVHGSGSIVNGKYSIVLGRNMSGDTDDTTFVDNLNIRTIGSGPFVNDVRIDSNGNLTTNTSDIRFKNNIEPITNALDTVNKLNGVTYQWRDTKAGGDTIKLGFVAQEVESIEPKLVFTNKHDGYKGIHTDGIIPLLVEAIKELSKNGLKTEINTQVINAEDNNIELNFNGNKETANGGGVTVSKGVSDTEDSTLLINENGDWLISPNVVLPEYTPSDSKDSKGNVGNICYDNEYYYVKTKDGWKRASLNNF